MRSWKKFLVILLVNAVLFGAAFLVLSYFAENRLPKTRGQFLSQENLVFYKKYSEQLNHLRNFDFLGRINSSLNTTKKDFLFTSVGKGTTQVLIQGDSWAEQFVTNIPSLSSLQNFSEDHEIELIIAGITSYSPSVMQAQYRLLRQDFGINPHVVVAVFDQTDIGDELCRYKNQLSVSAEGELIVKPYTADIIVPYYLQSYFDAVAILDSSESALIRLLKYKLAKVKPREIGGCGGNILSPLSNGLNEVDRRYLINRIENYIEEVFRSVNLNQSPKQLILVTHFHKKHLSGQYKKTIAQLVSAAVVQSKHRAKIIQLNFVPEDYTKENIDNIFEKNDPFSHLTGYYHRKVFTKRILNQIRLSLPDSRDN